MRYFFNKTLLIILSILVLGLFFRTHHLSSIAPSPHMDEITNGYNAYSLLKTGKDEFGKPFPALLQTYNDWRPAIFVYMTIPFVAIFGLTTMSVRLAPVTFSLISLILVYAITRLLLQNNVKQKNNYSVFFTIYAPLATMFLFAISPWSIYFSRQSHEVNASQLFLLAGTFTFLYFVQKKGKKYLPLSALFFAVSFFAYHGAKLFLLPFCLSLLLLYRNELLRYKKLALISIFVFLLVITPLLIAFTDKNTTVRLAGVSVFNQTPSITDTSAQRLLRNEQNHNYLGKIFDNRRIGFTQLVANNYLSNIDPTWLYVYQYNPAYAIPGVGLFHFFELFLLILGVYATIKLPLTSLQSALLICLWILFYPLSSAISTESPHPLRTYVGMFPFLFVEGIGTTFLLFSLSRLKTPIFAIGSYLIIIFVVIISLLYFYHSYFTLYPYELAAKYQYGVNDALEFAKSAEQNYDKIVVSYNGLLAQSYMHYLFVTQYNPATYLQQGGTKDGSFSATHVIGKYHFINPQIIVRKDNMILFSPTFLKNTTQKTLYIVDTLDLPESVLQGKEAKKVLVRKTFHLPNGKPSVYVIEKSDR